MLKNYLIVTFRNLGRNIVYVLINILALAFAMAVAITAYMNHQYDADWDRMHEHHREIFKVNLTREIQGEEQHFGACPLPVAGLVQQNISGVQSVTRYAGSTSPVKLGLNNYNRRIAYVDPNFLEVFTVPLRSGSAESLGDKQNLLISEEMASVYFGEEDPVGKILSIFNNQGEEYTFTVAGVFENLPLNTSFMYDILTHFDNHLDLFGLDETNWGHWTAGVFLRIPNRKQVMVVDQLLDQFAEPHNTARENFRISGFRLQPLADVGKDAWDMYSNWWVRQSFHPAAVTAPPIMALFILLIACFNFTNTSIAFSSKRLKEIGVRKVAGGHRRHIIIQFMAENFLLSLIALLLSLYLGAVLTRTYSAMWEYMDLQLVLVEYPGLILFLVGLLLFTTIIAGAYPSFYISRFNPINIFQDKLKIGGKNIFSLVLLGFQIAISVLAINSGIIFIQNAHYQNNVDMGYDKDHIIGMRFPNQDDVIAVRDRVRANPMIQSIGESDEHIGQGNYRGSIQFNDIETEVRMFDIGRGYFETMGLRLLDGRTFTPEFENTDRERSIIVNEKFISEYGIEDPIGTRVTMSDTVPLYIIGVMADFFPYGTWQEIEPAAFRFVKENRLRYLTVKAGEENLKAVNQFIEAQWKEIIPNVPYTGFFQDDLMNEARQINGNIRDMYLFLGLIALLLAAIGLYTLVTLSVIRRTKEVGVRKVMGASVARIMGILSLPYGIIIAIASVVGLYGGTKLSIILMSSIWELYTDLEYYTYLIPVALIIIVAALSIGFRVFRAATANPSMSLRYE